MKSPYKAIQALFLTWALFIAACGQGIGFATKSIVSEGFVDSEEGPSCLRNLAQIELSGSANSFEMTDTFGVTIGYGPGGSSNLSGSATVNVQKASMDLTMSALDPLSRQVINAVEIGANQTNTKINATIDFGALSANPSTYLTTPLSKVSSEGLALALAELQKNLSSTPWIGRVLRVIDPTHVILNAGSLSGIKVGDQFTVYNVTSYWDGSPCASKLQGLQRTTTRPLATLTISSLDASGARSFATLQYSNEAEKGAQVHSGAEVSPVGTSNLKKLVSTGKIVAGVVKLPDGTVFDFAPPMNSQMAAAISNSQFVLTSP